LEWNGFLPQCFDCISSVFLAFAFACLFPYLSAVGSVDFFLSSLLSAALEICCNKFFVCAVLCGCFSLKQKHDNQGVIAREDQKQFVLWQKMLAISR
jgi:hypothetical protein